MDCVFSGVTNRFAQGTVMQNAVEKIAVAVLVAQSVVLLTRWKKAQFD